MSVFLSIKFLFGCPGYHRHHPNPHQGISVRMYVYFVYDRSNYYRTDNYTLYRYLFHAILCAIVGFGCMHPLSNNYDLPSLLGLLNKFGEIRCGKVQTYDMPHLSIIGILGLFSCFLLSCTSILSCFHGCKETLG